MGGKPQSLNGKFPIYTADLEHKTSRLDHRHPALGVPLAFAHPGLSRFLGDGLIREYANPEFSTASNCTDNRPACGFDLAGSNLLVFHGHQAVIAKKKLAEILEQEGVGTDDKKAYKEFLQNNEEAAFFHNKVQTAIHFAYRALPTVAAKGAAIRSGEKSPFYAIM